MQKVLIIAEAGVNHNGDINTALALVDAAADAGADIVKFQTFKASKLSSRTAPRASYQSKNTGNNDSQLAMLSKLELSAADHKKLIEHCASRDIRFLSSAFDPGSLDFLIELGLDIFKIPSGEITNLPYLKKIGSLNKQVILSTGMSTMEEIGDALKVLADSGTEKNNITVLHCNTEYPTPYSDVNLLAMQTIGRHFDVRTGYSDHTQGIEVPVAAVALGATVIEKHFTLDRRMEGPDHLASLEPDELKEMVQSIRNIEQALGSPDKKPTASELGNRNIARKSIHLAADLPAGHELRAEDLVMKRPGTGLSPMQLDRVTGRKLRRSMKEDDLLQLSDIE